MQLEVKKCVDRQSNPSFYKWDCASAENWTEYLQNGIFVVTIQDNFIDSRKPGNPFESKLRSNQYTID
jgi:hypothetical protein